MGFTIKNLLKMFQSTLPCGERHQGSLHPSGPYMFQSTLPCGERPDPMADLERWRSFNPRSRAGSDGV